MAQHARPRRGSSAPLRALAAGALGAAALLLSRGPAAFFAPPAPRSGAAPAQPGRAPRAALRAAGQAEAAAEAKEKLLDFLEDEMVQEEVLLPEGRPTRGRVDEMILALEKQSSEDEPVYSELLDGSWKVEYSGSWAPGLLASPTRELALFLYGGFSLGGALSSFVGGAFGKNLGLKLGAKTVKIEGGRDVQATVSVIRGETTDELSYTAELMPLSGRRMSEEVMSVDLPAPIGKQDPPLELRRSILVTYLDDTVMVVRDETGVPDVLVRVSSAPGAAAQPAAAAASEGDEGVDPLISEAA